MEDFLSVEFFGPFSWHGYEDAPCIFATEIANKCGVYLWTISQGDGELIYYVGQTGRNFGMRMQEHFMEHWSGAYHLYSPEEFRHGEKITIWPGRYDRNHKTAVNDFIDNSDELFAIIKKTAALYRFFLAPLECDTRLRERIEAGIANHLYAQPGTIGSFQDQGIRYVPRRQDDTPLTLRLRCSRYLLGIPSEMSV